MRDAKQDIDLDIGLFLDKYGELTNEDRRALLRVLFQKHILLNQSELVLSKYDFDTIKSSAAGIYSRELMPPVKISKKEISTHDVSSLALMEAMISVLNGKNALKRVVKFER
jgi:hypothetical protein